MCLKTFLVDLKVDIRQFVAIMMEFNWEIGVCLGLQNGGVDLCSLMETKTEDMN